MSRETLGNLTAILDRRRDKTTKQAGATPFPVVVADLIDMLQRVEEPMRISEFQRVYQLWLDSNGRAAVEDEPNLEAPLIVSERLKPRVETWWARQPHRVRTWFSARSFGEVGPTLPRKEAIARVERHPGTPRLTPQRWGQIERAAFEDLRRTFSELGPDEFEEVVQVLASLIPTWEDAP